MTATIRYNVYQQHLDGDGSTTDAQADGYAKNLRDAIQREYPEAEVEVTVLRRVQGVGYGLQSDPEGVDADLIRRLAEEAEIPADTATATAAKAYGLTVYERSGSRALVGDGTERFWIDSSALDEEVVSGLTGEAEGDAYARWCVQAHAGDEA